MSADPAIEALARLLAEENASLRAMELGRAAALLPEKQRLAVSVEAALAGADRAALARLDALALENRAALARAMRVQRRVLDLLNEAARRAEAPGGYGRRRRGPARAMMVAAQV